MSIFGFGIFNNNGVNASDLTSISQSQNSQLTQSQQQQQAINVINQYQQQLGQQQLNTAGSIIKYNGQFPTSILWGPSTVEIERMYKEAGVTSEFEMGIIESYKNRLSYYNMDHKNLAVYLRLRLRRVYLTGV